MVVINGIDIEFVMTRSEMYLDNSRKPTVRYGTIQEDSKRRDFTINSIYCNIEDILINDSTVTMSVETIEKKWFK